MGKPAARILDPTAHGSPLLPGPGSVNVLIGFKPAWRGIPLAAAAGVQAAQTAADTAMKVAESATKAAAGTPGAPAAYAAEQATKASLLASMSSLMSSFAGSSDIHICPVPTPVPPHGPGVVIDGSSTVLINNMPACTQGCTVLEALGGADKIAMGDPTVLIGDSGGGGGAGVKPAPRGFLQALANAVAAAATAIVDAIVAAIGPASPLSDPKVAELIKKSPTLAANIDKLQKDNWTIRYGEAGKGTFADKDNKEIVIDPNEKGNPAGVVQSLAHESGHGLYTADPYVPPDGLTKQQYVDANVKSNLKDEGEATLTNAQIRDEILSNGGDDIGIAGSKSADYDKAYKDYKTHGDREKAREEIGNIFADGENPSNDTTKTYKQYYGEWWEKQYDKNAPKP